MAADPTKQPGPGHSPAKGHEARDASAKWLFGLVLLLFVSGLAIQWILVGFQSSLKQGAQPRDRWRPAKRAQQAPAPSFPRLQVAPPLDWQAFQAREEAALHSYGWVNRTAGVVHVPIERAMELVLQEGLSARSSTNKSQAGPSSYELIQPRLEHREPELQRNQ